MQYVANKDFNFHFSDSKGAIDEAHEEGNLGSSEERADDIPSESRSELSNACKYTEETLESENCFLALKEKQIAKQIGRMATIGLAPIMLEGIRSYYLYQLANVMGFKIAKEAFSLNEESGTSIRRGTRR